MHSNIGLLSSVSFDNIEYSFLPRDWEGPKIVFNSVKGFLINWDFGIVNEPPTPVVIMYVVAGPNMVGCYGAETIGLE